MTEKALSVDNLFVFLVLLGSFKVPRADQQKVLLFGIVFSLIARTGFIFLGAALINSFAWVFYLFGLILLITAGNLLKSDDTRTTGRPTTSSSGSPGASCAPRTTTTATSSSPSQNGKRVLTPMLLVMVAIGGTDILFALDSIPAIFGLTQSVYLVFTATAFSLLGLRQLYFLLDGLLDRLIYLSYGLAAILAFIGVKLILHALHENNVPFINNGEPIDVVEISTGALARLHHRGPDHHRGGVAAQPQGPGPDVRGRGPPARQRVPRHRAGPGVLRRDLPQAARRGGSRSRRCRRSTASGSARRTS